MTTKNIGRAVPNWMPKLRPSMPAMYGRYCTLETLDLEKHGALLFEAFQLNQGAGWEYLPYGPCDTLEAFTQCMRHIMADPDTWIYAILKEDTQKPLGVAAYLRANSEHGVVEVGHLHYSVLLQKTVAATEAMYLMMKYIFDDLHYRRYEWKCNTLNTPSKKAAERLGFTLEGVFRQSHVYKGLNRDTAWFSIIDNEWPLIKQKFESWLDPKNFDEYGQQMTALNLRR